MSWGIITTPTGSIFVIAESLDHFASFKLFFGQTMGKGPYNPRVHLFIKEKITNSRS
jgi:hypothetical protein